MKRIDRNETWVKQEDGTTILVSFEEVEVDILTPEEEISKKEAELLKMYKEIQDLKNNL
jgi:hypothetical protein